MLKFLFWYYYRDHVYTDEPELFYKFYKWNSGLFTLISLRRIIGTILFCFTGFVWMLIKPCIYGIILVYIGLFLFVLETIERKKSIKFNTIKIKTPAQIRTIHIENFIRKYISTNGKALGKKEWQAIKNQDIGLYNDLLCDECNHFCYFYSLEIAKIIKDSILIWGAIEEPFEEGHNYYAHAIILRREYIYDSNMRQSSKYDDFVRLYNFKKYKQWNYNEYSKKNFRANERTDFRKWCQKNNVFGDTPILLHFLIKLKKNTRV